MSKTTVTMRVIETTIFVPVVESMIFANWRLRNGIMETNMILAIFLVYMSVSMPEPTIPKGKQMTIIFEESFLMQHLYNK